jgi:hypothetical protein
MFVYALSIAIFHRDDMKHIVLPRACEVYPHYFVDHDVIQAAYKYMMKGTANYLHFLLFLSLSKFGVGSLNKAREKYLPPDIYPK